MTWPPDPDVVQHISLPLELLGMFLAMLEIFFHDSAKRIERFFDQWGNITRFRQIVDRFYTIPKGLTEKTSATVLMIVFALVMDCCVILALQEVGISSVRLTISLILLLPAIVFARPRWFRSNPVRIGLFLLFVLPAFLLWLMFISILLALGSGVLTLFNSFGKGHAIGGIGLTLGSIGLIGEIYQVLMIDRDVNPIVAVEYWSWIALLAIGLAIMVFFVHRAVKRS